MSDASRNFVLELKRKLASAANSVLPLALAGEFEQVERVIFAVDCDVYGRHAAADLYVSAIAALGGPNAAEKDLPRIRALFDRAVKWRENGYPSPHTEYEAQRYDEGIKQERGRTVDEVGFDPHT